MLAPKNIEPSFVLTRLMHVATGPAVGTLARAAGGSSRSTWPARPTM